MRLIAVLLLSASVIAQAPPAVGQGGAPTPAPAAGQATAPAPAPRIVGTMSDLMVKIIYPTSDAVFYITTRTPTNEVQWNELQAKTLMLAESANLLMMPSRARDQDRWMTDSQLLLDVATTAFKAAKAHDVEALGALNEELRVSCVTCHQHYRPSYGRRRQQADEKPSPK